MSHEIWSNWEERNEHEKEEWKKSKQATVNKSKIIPLTRARTRTLQRFSYFILHNLHRNRWNTMKNKELQESFGHILTL